MWLVTVVVHRARPESWDVGESSGSLLGTKGPRPEHPSMVLYKPKSSGKQWQPTPQNQVSTPEEGSDAGIELLILVKL